MPLPKDPIKAELARQRMSKSHKGHLPSDDTKAKMSEAHRGQIAWNLGIKPTEETRKKLSIAKLGNTNCLGYKATEETKMKMSAVRKGVPKSEDHKQKIREAKIGVHHLTEESKQAISEKMKGKYAQENHPNWRGGITSLVQQIRHCDKMKEWTLAVFQRDDYRDWFSGLRNGSRLEAHHIVYFTHLMQQYNIQTLDEALACDALWDINNGITMSRDNHTAYHHMWGWDRYYRHKKSIPQPLSLQPPYPITCLTSSRACRLCSTPSPASPCCFCGHIACDEPMAAVLYHPRVGRT